MKPSFLEVIKPPQGPRRALMKYLDYYSESSVIIGSSAKMVV